MAHRSLVLLPLVLFMVLSLRLIAVTPFPAPDELEHLSYAAHLQETGRFLPLFRSQTVLDRDDLTRWGTQANYIGHPSPYYLFIAQVLDRTLPPARAILAPRLASFALLLLGVAIALRAGVRWFGTNGAALAVFAVGLALCPEIFSAARQVTNDSLAILGGAVVYGGLAASRRSWLADGAVASGLALAFWAKPNAGIGVGALLGLLVLLGHPGRTRLFLAAAAGTLIGLLPTLPIVLTYGAIVPVTAEALFPVQRVDGLAHYVPAFFFNLGYTWGYLKTAVWPIPGPLPLATCLAFWAMLALIAAAIAMAWRHQPDPEVTLALATLLAFAALTGVHLFFSATSLGRSVPAASFRYDLPLLPALAHAAATAVHTAPTVLRRRGLLTMLALTMALGWIV